LVALRDTHGAETPVGGFSEADGLPRKLQGIRKFGNITLKRGYVSTHAFENWMNTVRSGGVAQRPDVILTQRDESNRPVAVWRLNHGVPLKYTGPTLGAKGNDVAMEELVLSGEGVELIPPK